MIRPMLVKMKLAWQCMFTPRLYKIYKDGPLDSMYEPRGLAKWSDKIISTTNTIFNVGLYSTPFVCLYVYRRGLLSADEGRFLMRCFGSLSCLFAFCYFLRGIGRASDPRYLDFVRTLALPSTDRDVSRRAMRRFDFDFNFWPVDFRVSQRNLVPWYQNYPFMSISDNNLPFYKRIALQWLAYLATHTFGLRLIYPGSIGLIHNLLSTALFHGRSHLVENYDGQRAKIETSDGNFIDTMFVDNRANHQMKGKILVVCCEGNSGFYEIGIMTTPAKAGYSAIGWNHPGFAGSTGRPYPNQENNAIDAVMQYAINKLGFQPEQIVLYGWSIGGYAAVAASINYPVQGLVLDATFDDLLPLALNQMPVSWGRLVTEVVRSYVNLNIAELLAGYEGPMQLIRRTDDEIICLRQGQLESNRANDLLLKVVAARHPDLPNATKFELRRLVPLQAAQRETLAFTSVDEHQLRALRLIRTYMRDYKSTHCTPLPEAHFQSAMENMMRSHRE